MVKELNNAEKTFGELEEYDFIYYLDPNKPGEIKELVVKGVTQVLEKKGWVTIEYYQSKEALELVTLEKSDLVPTKKLITKRDDKRVITMTMPPSVYFTNKKTLQNFINGK
jgi:hypothetical protein